MLEKGNVEIKKKSYLKKKEDSSIQRLLITCYLPGSCLTIKICFHHVCESTRLRRHGWFVVTTCCDFLFSALYKFVGPQNVGWGKGINCRFFIWGPLTTCTHSFQNAYKNSVHLDLWTRTFWGWGWNLHFWLLPRACEHQCLGHVASVLLAVEGFYYVWRNSANEVKWPAKGHRIS